ncbi:ATP-binding protein [Streptomyces sp. DT24]|uniref:ATP-binding protein n=1 Tax=unclassified Streptomyces TaxID=2593676 RepID=UPI0023B9CC19|nr:ATP-binding protein [Streptomyces sp. AM 4-1-1]WEH32056.1 ATP-binding protein [Streptomyces sp. AM 4-1-1]
MTVPLDRHYLVELRVTADRAHGLRRIVAAHLRHWDLELHVRPVCRGVDELLTNVRRHVGDETRCVVELRLSGRSLTVSVADDGSGMPRLLAAGGGLSRVRALSDSWGTCRTGQGKVVWFTRYTDAPVGPGRPARAPLPGTPATAAPSPAPAPV